MKLLSVLLFLLGGSLFTCRQQPPDAAPAEVSRQADEMTMRVNHYQQPCQGEGPATCLLVQTGPQIGTESWDLFYDSIEGFRYEPGYRYTLTVRTEKIPHPPMDASDRRYVLVKVVAREKVN